MNSPSIKAVIALLGLFFTGMIVGKNAHSQTKSLALRSWTKVIIPGATCGRGHPYVVWYEKRDPKKLAAEFMGGGACWNAKSCYGRGLRAWMFPLPQLPVMSSLSVPHIEQSPFWDHSMIYFPYCTGDVHAGNHVANYGRKKVYHTGHKNIVLALEFLKEEGIVDFGRVEHLSLFGSSAGAIGALSHTETFDKHVVDTAYRTLILDAPGLHFGKRFWNKFSDNTVDDFKQAFAHLGFDFSREDHVLAKYIPQVCESLKSWNIGILQGSKDVVMSRVFGNISQDDHRELVYGPQGVYQLARKSANCSAWVPDTWQHTFMVVRNPVGTPAGNRNPLEFVQEVQMGITGSSYR